MKKLYFAIAMVAILALTGSAWGTLIEINRGAGFYSGDGGEFTIYNYGAATESLYAPLITAFANDGGFQSFCLERDEYVTPGNDYNAVLNPDNKAVGGGINTNDGDPISRGTAYLYYLFSIGQLTGYNYAVGPGREASAAALQNTIWALEEEGIADPGTFTSLLVTRFGSWETAMLDMDMNYGVGVLNLTEPTQTGALGGPAQDQLVRTTAVPEPATMLLLGLGLVGLAGLRRKIG